MESYQYTELGGNPCLAYIYSYIGYSTITHKDYAGATFSDDVLIVKWETPLDAGDKAILDAIVAASVGKVRVIKETSQIMDEIFWQAYAEGGLPRVVTLCNGLDHVPSLLAALGNLNYPLARQRVDYALSEGWITQDDYDLAISKIPDAEYV